MFSYQVLPSISEDVSGTGNKCLLVCFACLFLFFELIDKKCVSFFYFYFFIKSVSKHFCVFAHFECGAYLLHVNKQMDTWGSEKRSA